MNVNGPITGFASQLGRSLGDDAILDSVEQIGVAFIPETFDDGEEFWSFNGAGVEFQFESEVLSAIFFHLEPEADDPELGVWDRPLIDQLPLPATVAQAKQTLGEPEETGEGNHGPWRRYRCAWGFLHLDFNGESTRLVTLMRHRP